MDTQDTLGKGGLAGVYFRIFKSDTDRAGRFSDVVRGL